MNKEIKSAILGKNVRLGKIPAIVMVNPKYPHNVGAALRAASCFGLKQLWFTGNRVSLVGEGKKYRLPREERMKGYKDVELYNHDYPFDQFENTVSPVAVEIVPNSEPLTVFQHPENAIYVFGPEDGSIPQVARRHCRRFVSIPTRHCTNLAAAIYIVLYDRLIKRVQMGLEPPVPVSETLVENRGWIEYDDNEEKIVV